MQSSKAALAFSFCANPYVSTPDQQMAAESWFQSLQRQICDEFERLECEYASLKTGVSPGKFTYKPWHRELGGGGTMSLMNGCLFEKVGVNVSTVFGQFSPQFSHEIPGADQNPNFWATGISLVTHMHSPLIPTVHMNTRHIITEKSWFGGGADLTPTFVFEEDTADFHQTFQQVCDAHHPDYYPTFKQWCDEYFFLPHRREMRGVGGIFYDYINSGSWSHDFAFTQAVGQAFLNVYPRIVRRRMHAVWDASQKQAQLIKRGRYVEFNLVYDRGTRFGLMTDGNTDAILMSLPPLASWT